MNETERVFALGALYGLAVAKDWDKVDDLLEIIDYELWKSTDQFSNIRQVEVYLDDNGIYIHDYETITG